MTTGPDNPIRIGNSGLPKSAVESNKKVASANLAALHTVTTGENLAQIARGYDLSLENLTKANGLTELSLIFPGQKLVIPIHEDQQKTSEVPTEHVVASGESIFSIAAHFGISVAFLQRLNDLTDKAILFPGTKLKLVDTLISQRIDSVSRFARMMPAQCLVHGYHLVKPGDQPSRIAAFHGVSTQALLTANSLSWNAILHDGQKLIVPISHGPLTCPSLVKLTSTALGIAENYVRFAKELNASDYVIVIALCLEMQRSGLVPEFGYLAAAKDLFQKLILVIGIETHTVKEALTSAGFQDLASGAALWEPSAWSWLAEVRRLNNV